MARDIWDGIAGTQPCIDIEVDMLRRIQFDTNINVSIVIEA